MELGNSLANYVTTERRDARSNKSGSKCLERWEATQATPRLGGKIKNQRTILDLLLWGNYKTRRKAKSKTGEHGGWGEHGEDC